MFGLNAVHKYCFALIKMPILDKNMLSLTVPHWYFDYVHHRHYFSDLYFKILQTHLWLIFELYNADKFSQIKCYNKVGQFGQIIFSAESLNNCISPIMCHDCDWLFLFTNIVPILLTGFYHVRLCYFPENGPGDKCARNQTEMWGGTETGEAVCWRHHLLCSFWPLMYHCAFIEWQIAISTDNKLKDKSNSVLSLYISLLIWYSIAYNGWHEFFPMFLQLLAVCNFHYYQIIKNLNKHLF